MKNPERFSSPGPDNQESNENREQEPKPIHIWAQEVTTNDGSTDTWYKLSGSLIWEKETVKQHEIPAGYRWNQHEAHTKHRNISEAGESLANILNEVPYKDLAEAGITPSYQLKMFPDKHDYVNEKEEELRRAKNVKQAVIRALTEEEADAFMEEFKKTRRYPESDQ